jgi:diguanylate cyclase (GGDEF)-like protein
VDSNSQEWVPNIEIDEINAYAYRIRASEPDQARTLAQDALERSEAVDYRKGRADALRTLGSLLSYMDRLAGYQLAIQAISIYSELSDEYGESSALLTSSLYFQHKGWHVRAHEVLLEAHEKAVRSGNDAVASVALYNLGVNARERLDFDQSLDYFLRAQAAAKKGENMAIYWVTFVDCESVRFASTDIGCDLPGVQRALDELIKLHSYANAISACHFIAEYSAFCGDHKKSRSYLRKGLRLAIEHDRPHKVWSLRHLKGELSFNRGSVLQARRSLEVALMNAQQSSNREGESKTLELLSRVYFAMADSTKAYLCLSKHLEIRNQLFSEETERRMREMQTIHQVRMIESESHFLKAKNEELRSINEELAQSLKQREKLQKELERIASTDELTGVFNRRRILSIGAEMVQRFSTLKRQGCVLILDLDNFKAINDTFGHNIGDEVLRRFTKSCERVLRPTDRLGRLGGEEFCVLLDSTSADIAKTVANRLLQAIRSTRTEDIMEDRLITASIGLTEIQLKHRSIEAVLHDADLALYEAKRTGRDKVCVQIDGRNEQVA